MKSHYINTRYKTEQNVFRTCTYRKFNYPRNYPHLFRALVCITDDFYRKLYSFFFIDTQTRYQATHFNGDSQPNKHWTPQDTEHFDDSEKYNYITCITSASCFLLLEGPISTMLISNSCLSLPRLPKTFIKNHCRCGHRQSDFLLREV